MKAIEARELFDRNASSYDWVNRVLSLSLDRRWRRWAAERAAPQPGTKVIEVMAGTAEISVSAALRGADVIAADISPAMLAQASRRASERGVELRTMLLDVTQPDALPDRSFDSVVLSFGLRYVDDRVALLRSLRRCLRPDGRLVLLEFCVPQHGLVSRAASLYFFRILPRVGAVLGAGPELYDYLRDSVRQIGSPEQIVGLSQSAGLKVEEQRLMGFGLVVGLVLSARD